MVQTGEQSIRTVNLRVFIKNFEPDGFAALGRRCLIGRILAWVGIGVVLSKLLIPNLHANDQTNWWSFQPLIKPALPANVDSRNKNPVDTFLSSNLAKHGLRFSMEASRLTLIRRLKLDLLGLPPTPEEVESFLSDPDPQAYDRLVERYLVSPHFGERWARHWLDVVHFGETHGYDKDKLRPNAWPYRDYVIRSFNEDKPYGRFVEEQVAGDALYPQTRDGIEALGFIAAGPWDFIGHEEVPESKIDGKIARHLDRDDMLVNTLQTFNSLTVQCAQCHNHKFDPISQEDYYSLHAIFAAVDRTDRRYDLTPETGNQRRILLAEKNLAEDQLKQLRSAWVQRAGEKLSDLQRQITQLEKSKPKTERVGSHSQIEPTQGVEKWFQIDLKQKSNISKIVLRPCHDDFNQIGDGFGFPLRLKIEVADDPEFRTGIVRLDESEAIDIPNPKLKPFEISGKQTQARFVRITATKLAPRQGDFIFALAEVEVMSPSQLNLAMGASVTGKDSIEANPRWSLANLTDGYYPGQTGSTLQEKESLDLLKQQEQGLLQSSATQSEKDAFQTLTRSVITRSNQLELLPPMGVVYAAGIHTGKGSFTGTGAQGGKPRVIKLLKRGNVENPGREVDPGSLSLVTALPARFEIDSTHDESARRVALARWLSNPKNPLTWRSIVNRVWQEHFGRGLVDTANDFGHMGASPSHPALLEWLAAEFRDSGQSLRALHRMIVTSHAYRQSSANNLEAARKDEGNLWIWRMNRRKLQAEVIRDSVLAIADRLDLRMGGPSFQDFVIDKPEHSPHFEYGWFDPEKNLSQQRSIYRFIVRSHPQPFMTVLDCADPSMQVAKRNESVSPLQALALMNNSLMLVMSRHFAERLTYESADLKGQLARGLFLALGRVATETELKELTGLAREHGLANATRVLFNLNEFTFVD